MKLLLLASLLLPNFVLAFQQPRSLPQTSRLLEKDSPVEEYRNAATNVLSNFMSSGEPAEDPLGGIDFDCPKVSKMPIDTLASMLDRELYEKEWFVNGNVNPSYFSSDFEFQDPDVKVSGIEDYARGVCKIFDQETSRAEIISTEAVSPNTITVTWRLSGKVNIGPGLTIKPYICYTDFTIDENGLVNFQEDRFDIPGWDILLSSLFPFLIGKVTALPAPEVAPRVFDNNSVAENGDSSSPLDKLFDMFK